MVTLPAVPWREGAGALGAPNLGLMEVPAREPIDILFRLGSIFKCFNYLQFKLFKTLIIELSSLHILANSPNTYSRPSIAIKFIKSIV
jgi:hypothetical protein